MFRRKPKERIEVEWMIAGLGNPGGEYAGTRHNVGFESIEKLAKAHGVKLDKSKHRAKFGVGRISGVGVVLVKPMTYMNLSGLAIKPLMDDFKIEPNRLLVIADETDLPLGRLRLRETGGAGGHNGHKSVIGALKTQDYARLRLGIGRVAKDDTIDHVLGRFEDDEAPEARAMIELSVQAVEKVVTEGLERAMNLYNG